MIKLIILLFMLIILYFEFSHLREQYDSSKKDFNIKITRLNQMQDQNISLLSLFDTGIWLPSQIDRIQKKREVILSEDVNDTLQFIKQKEDRKLCKGDRCLTIKGVLIDTLLLEDNNKMLTLKPGQTIFDVIIFSKIIGTTLFFENNETNETYKLKFFSYEIKNDDNKTTLVKQKDKQ